MGNASGNEEPYNKHIPVTAWIHEMLHKHGLWAVLSREEGLTIMFIAN